MSIAVLEKPLTVLGGVLETVGRILDVDDIETLPMNTTLGALDAESGLVLQIHDELEKRFGAALVDAREALALRERKNWSQVTLQQIVNRVQSRCPHIRIL